MNPFPAVMIGGPPHSGKSVLVYALSQAQVAHYVLRACPDGEGDWSQETSQDQVRLLRQKGQFSDEFVERVRRDIERRHLPSLVDVGVSRRLNKSRFCALAPTRCCCRLRQKDWPSGASALSGAG